MRYIKVRMCSMLSLQCTNSRVASRTLTPSWVFQWIIVEALKLMICQLNTTLAIQWLEISTLRSGMTMYQCYTRSLATKTLNRPINSESKIHWEIIGKRKKKLFTNTNYTNYLVNGLRVSKLDSLAKSWTHSAVLSKFVIFTVVSRDPVMQVLVLLWRSQSTHVTGPV